MNMSTYCKSQGFTLEQYKQYQTNIKATAIAILSMIKQNYKTDTGIYYPVNDIISFSSNTDNRNFIIQELKQLGVEFIDNNTLWRF